MGIYTEYLQKNLNFPQIEQLKKEQLKAISKLRGGRDIIVYASDPNKIKAPTSIDQNDIAPFNDQLSNLSGKAIDIIIETPGGFAEVVEDLVRLVRNKYESVAIIVPGVAKSAGTIFAMAGDEILMGATSALGPIDAQIIGNNKRYSADAFLEGLEKIKQEVLSKGRLNPAYIPILQNISPGEIQHCENSQNFSKRLVTEWLSSYKFKFWTNHSDGRPVTQAEKEERANEIASMLCKHSTWLTHSRSIPIEKLEEMGLKITDFRKNAQLNDAITRYYILLKLGFESTNMFKLFETIDTQFYRFYSENPPVPQQNDKIAQVRFDAQCSKCKHIVKVQAKLEKTVKDQPGFINFPKNNQIFCPNCHSVINLASIKLQIEAQTRKKIIN